jgi:hypothetical protein
VHLNHQFVYKALVQAGEVSLEPGQEVFEKLVNEVGLVFGPQMLVKVELFNDDVEVEGKGNFKTLARALKQSGVHVVRLVRLLDFGDPDVQALVLVADVGVETELLFGNSLHPKQQDCRKCDS